MPFIDGRFVMRSQLLAIESGEPLQPKKNRVYTKYLHVKEKALKLGYTSLDARLFGNPVKSAVWEALLESHETSDSRLSPAECSARKDWYEEDAENRRVKRRDRLAIELERKVERKEKRKACQAKREIAIAPSFDEMADSRELPVTYWLDTRNGIVLYQRPTAIQEPKFYVQLKSKALLDAYLAHAALYGKKEAVAIYGSNEVLIGGLPRNESEVDTDSDTRYDYAPEAHSPVAECEQFPRPKKWTEMLTRK